MSQQRKPDPSDDAKQRRNAMLGRAVGKPAPRQAANHPAGWTNESVKLPTSHSWKCSPGYQLLIANRGQLRLEYPQNWHNYFENDTIKLSDIPPPKDECRIQISIFQTPGLTPSHFHELPLLEMVRGIFDREHADDEEKRKTPGWKRLTPVELIDRYDGVQIAWCESRWVDQENGEREVFCRQLMARASGFHTLITFDYYANRAEEFRPVWQHLIKTLTANTPVNLLGEPQN